MNCLDGQILYRGQAKKTDGIWSFLPCSLICYYKINVKNIL